MLKLTTGLLTVVAMFAITHVASGQFYPNTHFHNVPHTQTHIDYVPHNGHVDAVPHTTTHFHQVPHTTFRPNYPQQQFYPQQQQQFYPQQQQFYPQQQQVFRPRVVPHTTTHNHLVPHNGHLDVVPHTTTHFDHVVPHTTTHNHLVPHGNHIDVVPHTTTHFDTHHH